MLKAIAPGQVIDYRKAGARRAFRVRVEQVDYFNDRVAVTGQLISATGAEEPWGIVLTEHDYVAIIEQAAGVGSMVTPGEVAEAIALAATNQLDYVGAPGLVLGDDIPGAPTIVDVDGEPLSSDDEAMFWVRDSSGRSWRVTVTPEDAHDADEMSV